MLGATYRTHRETACGGGAYLVGPAVRELLEIMEGEKGPPWFAWRDTPDHMSRPAKDRQGALALDLDKIAARASNAPPARAMVVADLPETLPPCCGVGDGVSWGMTKTQACMIPATVLSLNLAAGALEPSSMWVFFGTYTGARSKGIYASRLDLATGHLEAARLVAETPSPSFLAFHPTGRFLYAVNEVGKFGGVSGVGGVSAFAVDAVTGSLSPLNQQSSRGASPCHLTVDRTGRWVLVANYSSGNLAVLPVREDGSLGESVQTVQHEGWSVNPQRQEGPHAHSINLDEANRFAVAADLGIDKLMVYSFDAASGQLSPAETPTVRAEAGSGPRHLAFSPSGRLAFVINELTSTLSSFTYDAKRGEFKGVTTRSTLPPDHTGGNSAAEVQVHPAGKFVYGSNRGHNSLAVFEVSRGGRLTALGHASTQGKTPRGFGIDPTGRWLLAANQESDSVVVFGLDAKTGVPTPTGQSMQVGAPVCVKFLPAR